MIGTTLQTTAKTDKEKLSPVFLDFRAALAIAVRIVTTRPSEQRQRERGLVPNALLCHTQR